MDQRQFIITEDHRANFAGGSRYRVSKAGDSEWTAVTQNKILYVYSGIDESTPKYVVPVEADANANYAFPVKDAGGKTVAIIKHGMLQSMLRSTWQITDPNGTSIAEIMTGTITALLGRLLFFVPYNYTAYYNKQTVCKYKEHRAIFGKNSFTVVFSDNIPATFDQAIWLICGIIMLRFDATRGAKGAGAGTSGGSGTA